MAGTFIVDGDSGFIFTPDQSLGYNQTYTIRVRSGGIRDLAGNSLTEDFVSSFTTTDVNPLPIITTISPSHGVIGMSVPALLQGTGLLDITSITIDGTGVTVNDLGTGDDTRHDVQFEIADSAPIGVRVVTATTPGGTATGSFEVIANPLPLDENFETGGPDWTIDKGVWEVGTPTAGPGSCYTGTQCAGTVLTGNYPTYADSRLISAPLPLPGVSGDEALHLRFWEWFNYTDNGTTWNDVGTNIGYYSGGWTRRDIDLTAYAGQTVLLAFYHYDNNDGGERTGWYIDDVEVIIIP